MAFLCLTVSEVPGRRTAPRGAAACRTRQGLGARRYGEPGGRGARARPATAAVFRGGFPVMPRSVAGRSFKGVSHRGGRSAPGPWAGSRRTCPVLSAEEPRVASPGGRPVT